MGRPSHKGTCLISPMWTTFNVRSLLSPCELLQGILWVLLDPKPLHLPTCTMLTSHDPCLLAGLHAVLHITPLVMTGALSAGGDWAANGVATSSRFSAERAGFMATPSNLGG